MKLAFALFKYFPYGGLQRDCIKIAMECVARGHRVDIFALESSGKIPTPLSVTCIDVRSHVNYRRYEQFAQEFSRITAQGDYDAVVGFNRMQGLDYYFGADPCFAIKTANKPFWHRFLPRSKSFLRAENEVYGCRSKTRILLLSPDEIPEIQKIYATPDARFHQLPPAVGAGYFAPEDYAARKRSFRNKLGLTPEKKLLLMVGSGFRIKGVDRALQAMALLPQHLLEQAELMILGKDNQRPFERLARKLNLADKVHFMGGRDDAAEFMFAADLLLHPAYRESAGMVLVEAIAARLPLLVTDTCGYSFHVQDSGAGRVHASPFDVQRFSREMRQMLETDPEPWQLAADEYAATTDLGGLAQKAVDIFEQGNAARRTK